MILYRLKEMQCFLEKETPKNMSKLRTINDLKNALLKVNYKAEEVPEYSFDKIVNLLEELNKRKLLVEEKKLLKLIVTNEYGME